jgi:hypothetical protein
MNVKLLELELEKLRVDSGSPGYLNQLGSVPMRSLAMLICRALPPSATAHNYYPRRPPIGKSANPNGICMSPVGNLVMPAFLIHFD